MPDVPQPLLTAGADPAVVEDVTAARVAVENASRSATAWGEYGLTLRAYEFHPEADLCFRTAAALDSSDGRWAYLLGHHLAPTDPAAAVEWFRKAAEGKVPENARAGVRLRLAETLLAADRVDEARAALGDSSPESDRAKLLAARLAVAAGDDRRAIEFLAHLTSHPIAARQALTLQSQIYLRQNRGALAAHVSKAAATAPDGEWPDPIADEVRRRDHSRTGRMDEAARLLRDGRPLDAEHLLRPLTVNATDARPFIGLAEARLAMGDRAGSIHALEEGARVNPRDVTVNYQLGLRRFEDGEQSWTAGQTAAAQQAFRAAVDRFDVALAIDPTFGKALLLKGVAYQRFLGRADEGMAMLRQFVHLRPEVAEGHLLLGQALASLGKREEARESLRRAAELAAPGDRRAAEALAALGQSSPGPQ